MKTFVELVKLIRPAQWVKNGFVFLGILFGSAWRQPESIKMAVLTAVAFSLVASGVYILNDLFDRESDGRHIRKRMRPLAAKTISPSVAVILLALLWVTGFALGYYVSAPVLVILSIYVALNIAYSAGLKHVVLLDVFVIAAGFMLRILAGTTGIGIKPSQWILLCGLMVALFLGFAKRRAELYGVAPNGEHHRKVLQHYSAVFLDKMIVVTATCTILSYALYTMSPTTIQFHHTESLIYTLPFVIYGMFRYIYSLHTFTTGTDPAQEIFRDPHILISVLGWLVMTIVLLRS